MRSSRDWKQLNLDPRNIHIKKDLKIRLQSVIAEALWILSGWGIGVPCPMEPPPIAMFHLSLSIGTLHYTTLLPMTRGSCMH
jgi:hypothetical protein